MRIVIGQDWLDYCMFSRRQRLGTPASIAIGRSALEHKAYLPRWGKSVPDGTFAGELCF